MLMATVLLVGFCSWWTVSNVKLLQCAFPRLMPIPAYLVVFHAIQPSRSCDRNLRFRLQLLRFTTMFMSRSGFGDATPSASALQMLRQKRHNEASSFRSGNEDVMRPDLPNLTEYMTSPDIVAIKQERISPKSSPGIETPPVAHVRPFPPPVSLLDTLPAFMALSAAQNAVHEATITEVWMHLAAGYMVQAVAEQFLAYEVQGSGVLQEAFAWGFDADCTAQEGSDEWQINAMFFGQDEMVYGWDVIRDEHMRAVGFFGIPVCSCTNALAFSADSTRGHRPARASRKITRRRSFSQQIRALRSWLFDWSTFGPASAAAGPG